MINIKKEIIAGIILLIVIIAGLILINLDSSEKVNYSNNNFVVSHINSVEYSGNFSNHDYLKYEFNLDIPCDYEFDVLVYDSDDELVLEELNLLQGTNDAKVSFDLYLGDEFNEGEYILKIIFRDISSGNEFEILDDFYVKNSLLLMSEPIATTIQEGVMLDFKRIPIYSQGETINFYYQVFNMEVVDEKVSLLTGIMLFDSERNLIFADHEFAFDNFESDELVEKYFELDTSALEGVYYLMVKATDYNFKSMNEKLIVFEVK